MKYQDIIQQINNKVYQPVYFLIGEESYYTDKISDYISKNVLTQEEKEFNQHKLTALLINIIENRDDYLNKKNNLEKFCYQNTWNKINEKVISSLNEN